MIITPIPRNGLWHRLIKQDKGKGVGEKVKQDHKIQVGRSRRDCSFS